MRIDDGKYWYARRDDGRGVYPVAIEGWLALGMIIVSTLISGVAALIIKDMVPEIPGLWIAIFVVIVVADAVAFYALAKVKIDPHLTLSDYRAREARRS
jgi:hypothetical protein